MFKRTEEFLGGSLQGYATVSPARLVELFGSPSESDGYKVSGEYFFVNPENGEGFTLYDYKHTSLYGDGGPTPEVFWASTDLHEFHIGGPGNTDIAAVKAAVESLSSSVADTILSVETTPQLGFFQILQESPAEKLTASPEPTPEAVSDDVVTRLATTRVVIKEMREQWDAQSGKRPDGSAGRARAFTSPTVSPGYETFELFLRDLEKATGIQ